MSPVDGGAVCQCGRRTIEGGCFGCGLPPRKCECGHRDQLNSFVDALNATGHPEHGGFAPSLFCDDCPSGVEGESR